jgi:membrane protease YdiL (CAAX protease family)
MTAFSADRRLRNLDNRLLVTAVFVAAMALYLFGALQSEYAYGDTRFAIGYFATELQVAAFLLVVTVVFLPARRIGFRRPERGSARGLWPFAVFMLIAMGAWIAARLSVPSDAAVDNETSVLILRTTLLVGLTEEWIFRGLLLAALSRWLGLRRGAAAALVLFGLFHLLNIAAGVPPAIGAVQAMSTMLIGSTFLLAAVETRSLAVPILAHAFYDFAVIDMTSLMQAGASGVPILVVSIVGVLAGIVSLIRIARLQAREPYGA